ncbi:DoxX family protein [Streptomyces sp. NPDC085932]|uniref:DoxX family protein n=1 Tax=Streptomyces sp. NPDC085932 TaxID=3365741 RepID=UPI0037CFD9F5
MYILTLVLSALLALAFLAIGGPKALKTQWATDRTVEMGLGLPLMQISGVLEVTAALGLIVGLWWRPVGVAASAGLTLLMLAALLFHARRGDAPKSMVPAAVLAVLAGGATVAATLSI